MEDVMRKLNVEDLTVDSFDTSGAASGRGTVQGLSYPTYWTECTAAPECGVEPTGVGGGWTCQNTCNPAHGTTCQTDPFTNDDTCCNSCDYCRATGLSCEKSCTA
jgi:hypothetical protein